MRGNARENTAAAIVPWLPGARVRGTGVRKQRRNDDKQATTGRQPGDRAAVTGNRERRTTNRHVHTPGHAQCFVKAGLLACRHPSQVMPSRAEHSGVGPGSSGLQQRGLRRTGRRWSSHASPASRFTLRQTSRRAPFTCERDSTGRNARLSPPYCVSRWRSKRAPSIHSATIGTASHG